MGASAARPDGTLKVTGEFAFSSDLWMAGMLWGATVRSPHPRACIRAVGVAAALRLPGVAAVLTHDDVPGRKTFGLEAADQPVLAADEVRYQGEPVVIVAADHPETARRAAAAVTVDYEVLSPVTDAEDALAPGAPLVHPAGNLVRHVRIRRGDPAAPAERRGSRQLPGRHAGPGVPRPGIRAGGARRGRRRRAVRGHPVAARRPGRRSPPASACRRRRCGSPWPGVGGAFGAREDLSMQIHACLLALRTGRPVKMVYSREESFFGHVHRHPATLHYEHGAAATARWSTSPRASTSTAAPTRPARPRSSATPRRSEPALIGAERLRRQLRRLHQQPAVRGDARLRRRAGVLRLRVPDGRAGRGAWAWTRSGSASPTR